jgi:nickel-dependent lactate racemase
MDVIGRGDADAPLADEVVVETLAAGVAQLGLDGARVLVLVPDGTRSMPLGALFGAVHDTLAGKVAALDVLIALGTHQPMSPQAIATRLGAADPAALAARFPGVTVHNHRWDDPATFAEFGRIPAEELSRLSGGMLAEDVPVRVNKLVAEYDACLVLGPVFPHEVVGFSGGNKYFFPGVSGPEVIDVSHWLGALITSYVMIGSPGTTPVRALINRAAAQLPVLRLAATVVVAPDHRGDGLGVHGVWTGTPEDAWAAAAELSAKVHVRYLDRPVRRVVSVMPPMYDDIWTAAKGMYKVEPVVADGGEVIVVAPHVTTFSVTHDRYLRRIGYHCRDYFLAQLDRFADVPRGVLAHSTHLRGNGTYDAATGTEHPRVRVTLATAISREDCEAANLSYRDPATIDLDALAADPDTLVIPKAGELLYRLR